MDEKWDGWILAAHGHGIDWYRMFGHVTRDDIWRAIVDVLDTAPVVNLRVTDYGISCGVRLSLTVNDRTAEVQTAWQFDTSDAAPRLLTAYPTT